MFDCSTCSLLKKKKLVFASLDKILSPFLRSPPRLLQQLTLHIISLSGVRTFFSSFVRHFFESTLVSFLSRHITFPISLMLLLLLWYRRKERRRHTVKFSRQTQIFSVSDFFLSLSSASELNNFFLLSPSFSTLSSLSARCYSPPPPLTCVFPSADSSESTLCRRTTSSVVSSQHIYSNSLRTGENRKIRGFESVPICIVQYLVFRQTWSTHNRGDIR